MDPSLFESLGRRAFLLPAGVCLIIAGIVMRGIARSALRDQTFRKQHDLLDGPPGDPAASGQPDAFDRHLEKYLPRYATTAIALGVILTITGFFR